jgi:hypothetical protein
MLATSLCWHADRIRSDEPRTVQESGRGSATSHLTASESKGQLQ